MLYSIQITFRSVNAGLVAVTFGDNRTLTGCPLINVKKVLLLAVLVEVLELEQKTFVLKHAVPYCNICIQDVVKQAASLLSFPYDASYLSKIVEDFCKNFV